MVNRSTQTPRERATNDMRVRKKLSAWLKNASDVQKILINLPEDQIRDISTDEDIYQLLNLTEKLVTIRKFYPIEGPQEKPELWRLVIDGKFDRLATDKDIARSEKLNKAINKILAHFSSMIPAPVTSFPLLMDGLRGQPGIIISEGLERAITRIKHALEQEESK